MSKEHPILMSTPMVQAILEGRKTQTRRILKDTTEHRGEQYNPAYIERWKNDEGWAKICPYGKIGDRLWVRETWATESRLNNIKPNELGEASECELWYKSNPELGSFLDRGKWRPSIFMPRWASRITLEITNIRVEKLQEITDEDAMKEGITVNIHAGLSGVVEVALFPKNIYARLWDSINGKKHSWVSNPFVWVISFKRI